VIFISVIARLEAINASAQPSSPGTMRLVDGRDALAMTISFIELPHDH
jgi:hypothetical protein